MLVEWLTHIERSIYVERSLFIEKTQKEKMTISEKTIPKYDKVIYDQSLTFSAESTKKRLDKIPTIEDILEMRFHCKIQHDIGTAAPDGLVSVFRLFKSVRIFAGKQDFVYLSQDEIKALATLWQKVIPKLYETGGGLADLDGTATDNTIEFDFTLPVFVKRGTNNLSIEVELNDYDKVFDKSATGTVTLDSLDIDVSLVYSDLSLIPEFATRAGRFKVQSAEYIPTGASDQERINLPDGKILDFLLIYVGEETAAAVRANHMADNIDEITLDQDGEKVIKVKGSSFHNFLEELGITQLENTLTVSTIGEARNAMYWYLIDIDELPIGANTVLEINFNASSATTDKLHVIYGTF